MKYCNKCKEYLPDRLFNKRSDTNKLRSHCKKCLSKQGLSRYYTKYKLSENRRKTAYKYNLKRNYNLTVDEYNSMFLKQDGLCAICKGQLNNIFLGIKGLSSCIDHCHSTNKIRKLLCNSCNTGLGNFRDNPVLLEEAIKYLKE